MNGPLVDASELRARLSQTTVLDIRWQFGGPPGRGEYLRGHIAGAAFVDLDTELAGPAGAGGRHPLPDPDAFEAVMRRAGVFNDRPVVAYDAATSMGAARAWWLLRYFGHQDVKVLDGGLAAWVAGGYEVEDGAVDVPEGDFVSRPGAMPLLDARSAARLAADGVLLDARSAERFRGESDPVDPIAGHIPGARNRPTTENLAPDGRFLDTDSLRREFAALGASAEDGVELGAYCGSGITAAHEVLALELAGYGAGLYVGSWSEWITDPGRPIETGAGGPG